jgi:alkylation response protein AidB-like acyl-CoA dehydrogenase
MLLNERDVRFLLFEFLDTEALLERDRYKEHSREVFDGALDLARQLAEKFFAPYLTKGDQFEPRIVDGEVKLIPEAKQAWTAFAEAGYLGAHCDTNEGGLQLPEVILRACMAWFNAANVGLSAYPMLSIGVLNLIRSFGSSSQVARTLPHLITGKWSGTMALTEAAQGSALGDIKTYAIAQTDGSFRVFGAKMFISAGDHDLTENIIHMVLARIKGAPQGAKGISLFMVPKFLIERDGRIGARNDVVVTGLLHKMGWRQTSSTMLNFGEHDGAYAELLGEPHKGLGYMFQMMNEARIGVGLFATGLAYRAYQQSLDYARSRPQGRLPSNRDVDSPQVMLIEHADIRRLLLTQKVYAEGALALCLYAASLFEDESTAPDQERRTHASLLLDLITPIVKSWPSRYGCIGNDLAIQVYGGAGYTKDHPVELLYRDQRLNPIHEGTEAIHALDLLRRKIAQGDGRALDLLSFKIAETVAEAKQISNLSDMAAALESRYTLLMKTTGELMTQIRADCDAGLANATVFLDFFGRVIVAWIWIKQALAAQRALEALRSNPDNDFYLGKLRAARFYIEWELPVVEQQAALLISGNQVPAEMLGSWF